MRRFCIFAFVAQIFFAQILFANEFAQNPESSSQSATDSQDSQNAAAFQSTNESPQDSQSQNESAQDSQDSQDSQNAQDSQDSQSQNESAQDSQDSQDSQNAQDSAERSIFATASVTESAYSSFTIGYQMLFKKWEGSSARREGIFFALDRGWLFVDDILLFGFSLDGTAGSFYSLNINAKLGARLWDGRFIPSISFGYGLTNHMVGDSQYNLHGANGMIALFVDIARGFGLEVSYRMGLHPYPTISKSSNIKVSDVNSFMVSLKFMDFSW